MSSRSLSSQGWRSLSVSGTPPFIFAIFAAEWKSSASWNSHSSSCANNWPIVVLPAPVTPQIIITTELLFCPNLWSINLSTFNR